MLSYEEEAYMYIGAANEWLLLTSEQAPEVGCSVSQEPQELITGHSGL